jgi:hypothetical protein
VYSSFWKNHALAASAGHFLQEPAEDSRALIALTWVGSHLFYDQDSTRSYVRA